MNFMRLDPGALPFATEYTRITPSVNPINSCSLVLGYIEQCKAWLMLMVPENQFSQAVLEAKAYRRHRRCNERS